MREYDNKAVSGELIDFITASPSAFHSIKTIETYLTAAGYTYLHEGEKWSLEEGRGYFTERNGSSIIAFRAPGGDFTGFNIAASHSDSPCYKLKDKCEFSSDDFIKLNTEKYGGMICSSWFDRPLSVAGRLVIKDEEGISIKLVNVDEDILLIPNVAIHMNGSLNTGYNYNAAVDTLPLYSLGKDSGSIMEKAARCAGVDKEMILGADLYVYNRTEGRIWGGDSEFVSIRGLDDLQCAFSTLKGFLASDRSDCVPVFACFDNEEVGSATKQGAGSTFLYDTLKRICLGMSEEDFRIKLSSSFLLSCDNAHAVHPNHPEYSDGLNKVKVNGGIVLKFNAAQRYTTDSVSGSVVKLLCERNGIPYQTYANRSDIAGGSTLGGIASTRVSINSADVGLAQYAMHSSYESAGVKDTACLIELSRVFFETPMRFAEKNKYQL